MGLADLFSPGKLKITAYNTPERKKEGGGPGLSFLGVIDDDTFEAPVQVDSYTQQFGLVYQKTAGINTSSQQARYIRSKARKAFFNLVLDGTGALNTIIGIGGLFAPTHSVTKLVDQFLHVCYDYDSELHEPKFLKIEWGEFELDCRLESVEIKYSVIDKGGEPLRAELSTVFIEDISDAERAKREDKKSPDITHSRMLKAGDSLPLLAKQMYGSTDYYLKLAAFNGIDHFRALQPGEEIQLPPKQILDTQI